MERNGIERNLWETIASQCAPVLMDVKPSNLLILTRQEDVRFRQMEQMDGISTICLHSGKKSTWLLYRKNRLEAALFWPQVREFLETYGYGPQGMDAQLERLAQRYARYKEGLTGFPHELGIFLGYPLGDVEGFIRHRGKNYLCAGYWKVYQDEHRAKETFRLYRLVRETMLSMLSAGGSLHEISGCAV